MTVRRERDLRELSLLEKEKEALQRRILTIRKRLIRTAHHRNDTETAIVDALSTFGALSFQDLVDITARNRNTVKSVLRGIRGGGRVIHQDRKYSV